MLVKSKPYLTGSTLLKKYQFTPEIRELNTLSLMRKWNAPMTLALNIDQELKIKTQKLRLRENLRDRRNPLRSTPAQ